MVAGSYQKENSLWSGLWGVLKFVFFKGFQKAFALLRGEKKRAQYRYSTSCWSFRCLYFLCKVFLSDFFFLHLHLWCRNPFLSNVRVCMHFASIHCPFSDLRGAVPYFQYCQNEQNQLAGPNLLLLDLAEQGAFVSAGYETCSLVQ